MSALAFELPVAQEAVAPPEARGIARDDVRLLVADDAEGTLVHARFRELPALLSPADLVVINVSATLPAALRGRRGDALPVRVHVAGRAPGLDGDRRVVEMRSPDGASPATTYAGERIALHGGASLEVLAPHLPGGRLWVARFRGTDGSVQALLERAGTPIRYGYVREPWPLELYQNVYATTPGSAEMPSAGRPFTARLIDALVARGVGIAPITLHCGVSSPEAHEPPAAEWFSVPETTAARIAEARAAGGRVIAVGTTVVRALESAVADDGTVHGVHGWTELVIDPSRDVASVDGMITGWHEPEASHLLMLGALASEDLLARSYREALRHGYLWHEFGDSHLILR